MRDPLGGSTDVKNRLLSEGAIGERFFDVLATEVAAEGAQNWSRNLSSNEDDLVMLYSRCRSDVSALRPSLASIAQRIPWAWWGRDGKGARST